jgi:hypothetical protein
MAAHPAQDAYGLGSIILRGKIKRAGQYFQLIDPRENET